MIFVLIAYAAIAFIVFGILHTAYEDISDYASIFWPLLIVALMCSKLIELGEKIETYFNKRS